LTDIFENSCTVNRMIPKPTLLLCGARAPYEIA
jgi:hypothetical protein